jgi:hypothetical protein
MRRQWPRADVVETGLVTDPDPYYRGHHYAKWRHPFTGRVFEMWGDNKTRALCRAICAWRRVMQEYIDAVEKALQ